MHNWKQKKSKENKGSKEATEYKLVYSVTMMDEYGRQSYTYQADSNGNKTKYVVQKATTDAKGNTTYEDEEKDGKPVEKDGNIIEYHYSANGSLASSTDNRNGNTTHYVAGQAAYITNREGSVISQYQYYNGILQTIQNFNNGTVTNTTVFDAFGRQLGVVQGAVTYQTAVDAINRVLRGEQDLNTTQGAKSCIVQSVSVYRDYVESGLYGSFLSQAGYTSGHAKKTYGYNTAIGSTAINTGDGGNGLTVEETKGDKETKTSTGKDTLAGKYKIGGKSIKLESGSSDRIKLSKKDALILLKAAGVKGKDKDIVNKYLKSAGKGKYYINLKQAKNKNKLAKAIFKALGIKTSKNMKFTVKNAGIKGYFLGNSYKTTVKKTMQKTYKTTATASLTTTFAIQGISVGQKIEYTGKSEHIYNGKKQVGKTETVAKSGEQIDPAAVGTVDRIVTVKGKKYAVLKNAKVDMVDGKGFQSADGEEIYVCIDGLSKDQQKSLKKGATFAAAGYIDKSADGHYAINNIYASKIGSDTVHNMVQSFSATLQGNAEYQTNLASNMINIAKGKAAGSIKDDYNYKELWKFYTGANF